MYKKFLMLLIVLTTICCLLLLTLFLNPYSVGILDSFLLRSGCHKEEFGFCISGILSLMNLFFPGYCFEVLCQKYHRFRCHLRVDEMYLHQLNWWDKYTLTNFSIHAEEGCNFRAGSGSRMDENIFYYLSPHHYLRHEIDTKVNVLDPWFTEIIPVEKSSNHHKFPPALRVKDLSIDIHSISRPVIDINASDIKINIFAGTQVIPIAPTVQVPLTIVRIGGWTLDEFFSMIPPPPSKEGLYPRLGVLNLTNVRISTHTVKDDVIVVNEIVVPDEFFYPLYQLTSLAGMNGTDQMFISSVIMKSIIMVLRKHTIKDDGIVSQSIQNFLLNIQKSSEIMEQVNMNMQVKLKKWTDLIDDEVVKALEVLHHFMLTIEKNWNEAINNESSPLYNLSKEAKHILEGIDDNLSKVGHSISQTIQKVETDLNMMTTKSGAKIPQVTKKIQESLNIFKSTLKEKEHYFYVQATKMKMSLEEKLNEASNKFGYGIKKAKNFLEKLAGTINQTNEL